MNGLALAYSALPLSLIARHGLDQRVAVRAGSARSGLAPGPAGLAPRAATAGDVGLPPRRKPTLAKNEVDLALNVCGWGKLGAEPVEIPATLLLDGTLWYGVRQGVQGLLARDEQGRPHVYMLCEPATYYYRVMTRSRRMPVLIGERI